MTTRTRDASYVPTLTSMSSDILIKICDSLYETSDFEMDALACTCHTLRDAVQTFKDEVVGTKLAPIRIREKTIIVIPDDAGSEDECKTNPSESLDTLLDGNEFVFN